MISREEIEDLFEHTRALYRDRKARWNIDEICRWSFFFVDASKEKLRKLGEHLQSNGYEFVGFLDPNPDNDDQETVFLRVDKVEKHDVDTLLARNDEFYKLAERFKVREYDGMDVGPVDSA
jgi:hypothetical protein